MVREHIASKCLAREHIVSTCFPREYIVCKILSKELIVSKCSVKENSNVVKDRSVFAELKIGMVEELVQCRVVVEFDQVTGSTYLLETDQATVSTCL